MSISHSILLPKRFAHYWDVSRNPRFEHSGVVMKKPDQEHCADGDLYTTERWRQGDVCKGLQNIVKLQQPQRAKPKQSATARKERNNIHENSHDPFCCLIVTNPY